MSQRAIITPAKRKLAAKKKPILRQKPMAPPAIQVMADASPNLMRNSGKKGSSGRKMAREDRPPANAARPRRHRLHGRPDSASDASSRNQVTYRFNATSTST